MSEFEDEAAVKVFTDLLKFETVSSKGHINGSYSACAQYIIQIFTALASNANNITAHILPESKPDKPIVCVEWPGSDQTLPCIFWNSHYDVVPIMAEHWTVPAFEVCVMYLAHIASAHHLLLYFFR
jgi:acetylornithine deacetylase/succinyl-diaminopimelate desuccinylase-like protein